MTTTNDRARQQVEFLGTTLTASSASTTLTQQDTVISTSMPTGPWLERAEGLITGAPSVSSSTTFSVMASWSSGPWTTGR